MATIYSPPVIFSFLDPSLEKSIDLDRDALTLRKSCLYMHGDVFPLGKDVNSRLTYRWYKGWFRGWATFLERSTWRRLMLKKIGILARKCFLLRDIYALVTTYQKAGGLEMRVFWRIARRQAHFFDRYEDLQHQDTNCLLG